MSSYYNSVSKACTEIIIDVMESGKGRQEALNRLGSEGYYETAKKLYPCLINNKAWKKEKARQGIEV